MLTGNLLTGKLPATNITGTLRTLVMVITHEAQNGAKMADTLAIMAYAE